MMDNKLCPGDIVVVGPYHDANTTVPGMWMYTHLSAIGRPLARGDAAYAKLPFLIISICDGIIAVVSRTGSMYFSSETSFVNWVFKWKYCKKL